MRAVHASWGRTEIHQQLDAHHWFSFVHLQKWLGILICLQQHYWLGQF
jgi:hypothetical protein